MSFILLPTGESHKKPEKSRLKKLPAGLVGRFYSNLAGNIDKLLGSEFNGRIANDADIPSKDVQKNIFATSDFAKVMQRDIDHYVTKDRINNASFRQKVWSNKQEYYKKTKSTWTFLKIFQHLMPKIHLLVLLLKELDVWKEDIASELTKNAPRSPEVDFAIKNILNKLKDRPEPKHNNNNFSPPPSSSWPPRPPSFFHNDHHQDHHQYLHLYHHHQEIFYNYFNHLFHHKLVKRVLPEYHLHHSTTTTTWSLFSFDTTTKIYTNK